jgi:6-phospho-3-hexuloisomerase
MNNLEDTYRQMTRAIIAEHEQVFEKLDMSQLKAFLDAIVKARNIFVYGSGREGISMRGFAMRLAHLGKPTYWLFDDTTIGMHEGDLMILADGRGDVGIHRYFVKRAHESGATIAVITGLPEGQLAKEYADVVLYVHATVYLDEGAMGPGAPRQQDVVPTVQPMGNQFEQHLYLLMDVVAILLKDEMGLSYADMEARHRNIE